MSEQRKQLAAEAAKLAKVIGTLEQTVAEIKTQYWAKVRELYTLEADLGRGYFADRTGDGPLERLQRGDMTAEDVFRVAEGAVEADE